jgi:hypothetical protein
MKTKRFNKKLSLTKTTIANLANPELNNVKGGLETCGLTCTCVLGCETITCPVGCPPDPTVICPDIRTALCN